MSTRCRILIVLEKGSRNYSAYAPEVPGCVATGKTAEGTLRLMREALQLHLEGIAEDDGQMPLTAGPMDEAYFVDVEVNLPATALHQAS